MYQSATPSKNLTVVVMAGYFLNIWMPKSSSILNRYEEVVMIPIWMTEKIIE